METRMSVYRYQPVNIAGGDNDWNGVLDNPLGKKIIAYFRSMFSFLTEFFAKWLPNFLIVLGKALVSVSFLVEAFHEVECGKVDEYPDLMTYALMAFLIGLILWGFGKRKIS